MENATLEDVSESGLVDGEKITIAVDAKKEVNYEARLADKILRLNNKILQLVRKRIGEPERK